MQVLQRPEWHGEPTRIQVLWALRKSRKSAQLELWTHVFGWELRLLAGSIAVLRAVVGGQLLRSEVFREQQALFDAIQDWRTAMEQKGWSWTV